MNKIVKGDKILYYKVVEKNIKHTYFKVQDGFLLVNKATKMPIELIVQRIEEKFLYFYQLTKPQQDNKMMLWGSEYKLELFKGREFKYEIIAQTINVYSPNENYYDNKIKILFLETRKYLELNFSKIGDNLQKHKFRIVPIKLKLLKSKYGSYHYKDDGDYIVINVFLASLNSKFLEYVLYHEFAHQKEKGHQKSFYEVLQVLFNEHRKYEKELKKVSLNI